MVSSNPELGGYKGSAGSCPGVLHISPVSPRFSLVLDLARPGKEGWECSQELQDKEGGIVG